MIRLLHMKLVNVVRTVYLYMCIAELACWSVVSLCELLARYRTLIYFKGYNNAVLFQN